MKGFKKILSGDFFKSNFWKKNSTFFAFTILLAFIYILIGSYGDILSGKIDYEKYQLTKLNEKYVMYESKLMQLTLESNIEQKVKKINPSLKRPAEPILIIEIDTTKNGR